MAENIHFNETSRFVAKNEIFILILEVKLHNKATGISNTSESILCVCEMYITIIYHQCL